MKLNELKEGNYIVDTTRYIGEEYCNIRGKQLSQYGLSVVDTIDKEMETINNRPAKDFEPAIITEKLLGHLGFNAIGNNRFQKDDLTIEYIDNGFWYLSNSKNEDKGYYKYTHQLQNVL